MNGRFTGRVAVVTGSAQSIGLECATAFAREGAHAVLTDINAEQAQAAAQSLREQNLSAIAFPLDVREPEQIAALVQRVAEQFGQLDIWVNNAGLAHHYDSFDLPRELWQHSLDVMLSGPFFGSQAAGKYMRDHGGGAIVNMASVNAMVPQPRRAAYCSAKAGVVMLTQVLASEWAQYGIRVNAVAPSPVATSGMAQAIDSVGITSLSQYTNRHPMKRMAAMREVTEAVLFLASDEASFVTGETLCVDGGWVAYGYL
ncbi:MAG TPA: SDR family oxidoreductase [Anaerolineae bacterium]|nr:SDR family oxidoreductase [Anaerolineae bacterium]